MAKTWAIASEDLRNHGCPNCGEKEQSGGVGGGADNSIIWPCACGDHIWERIHLKPGQPGVDIHPKNPNPKK